MRGVLVMTMATISPCGGKFPRQDRPAGDLDWFCSSSASWRRRFLPKASSWFFLERNPPYSKRWEPEGQQGAHKPPRRSYGGRPCLAGLWPPGGSPLVLLPPSIIYKFQNNSSLIFTAFGVAQNRYLKLAPFSDQNSSCRHSPSSCKPYKIREKRHKYCTVKCNNNP